MTNLDRFSNLYEQVTPRKENLKMLLRNSIMGLQNDARNQLQPPIGAYRRVVIFYEFKVRTY